MIKLTALNYKIKISALEIYHNINELAESRMFEWEEESKRSAIGGEYVDKPFIEPHEFKTSDYDIKERKFRVRPEDILFYKENLEGIAEVTMKKDVTFAVKESIDYLDGFFEESKTITN